MVVNIIISPFDYPQLWLARAIRRDNYVPSTVEFVQGGVLATHFRLGDRSQHHYLARYGDGRAPWSSIRVFSIMKTYGRWWGVEIMPIREKIN